MPESIQIVGSRCMDLYFSAYKSQSDFFDIEDFIYYAGITATDIFQKEFKAKYAENRAMKIDDVVGFPADWLLEQNIKIESDKGILSGKMEYPVMGFSYDNQVIGVQDVLPLSPLDVEFERSTVAEKWQLKYVPKTNRVYWYVQGSNIRFIHSGLFNLKEATVLYIPSISDNMLIPDGIVKMVIDQTVGTMKTLEQNKIIKKSLDGNENKVMQLETNTLGMK